MITEYDLLGLATKTIDLNGIATFNYYDERGRLTKATYPEIGDVDYFYDATGLKTKVTDALDQSTEYFFDYTRHVLTRTLDAVGKELRYFYDSANRVTKTGAGSTADIMPTLNYYDGATGRMTKTRYTDAASNTADVEYFFNGGGQMTKLTDWTSGDNDLFYAYSDIGQLTKFTDYDSEELAYAYDAVGRVTSMTDYHGATTAYGYDIGGRLTTITAPGSKLWEFVYNDLGQVVEQYNPNESGAKTSKLFQCHLPGGQGQGKINPDALVETYGYDSRNRLTRRYLGTEVTGGVDLEEFVYALDNAGNITRTTELDGTVWDYEYDDRYRLTSATAAIDTTKAKWKETYVYDDGDNLLTKTTPVQDNFDDLNDNDTWSGHANYVATKGYLEYEAEIFGGDFVNAMDQSEDDFQAWFSFSYAGGATADISLRNASPSSQVQLSITDTRLTLRGSGGILDTDTISTPSDIWYEYYVKCDGADVEVWRREKGATDALVKVLETDSATDTSSSYFSVEFPQGNYLDDIVFLALNGDTLEDEISTYNAANELTGMTVNGDSLTFTYDQFGRMTQKTDGTYTGTYYYHYGDKLTKVASNFGGEGTVTYTVGGDQKRRSRAVSGGDTTKYRYDAGWEVLNEEDGTGTLELTRFGGLAASAGSTAASGTWSYYFTDVIGSTRGLWDQDGARLGKYEYTPFGGKYADSGNDVTRKYTGHDWDSTSRLYHTAYRYYSPDSNRWLTRDPLGMVDGPNVYAYVVNNPVTMSDPLGMFSLGSLGGVGFRGFVSSFARGFSYSSYVLPKGASAAYMAGVRAGQLVDILGVMGLLYGVPTFALLVLEVLVQKGYISAYGASIVMNSRGISVARSAQTITLCYNVTTAGGGASLDVYREIGCRSTAGMGGSIDISAGVNKYFGGSASFLGGQAIVGHLGWGGGSPVNVTASVLCVSMDGSLGGLLAY